MTIFYTNEFGAAMQFKSSEDLELNSPSVQRAVVAQGITVTDGGERFWLPPHRILKVVF